MASGFHNIFLHKEWGLAGSVFLLHEGGDTVIDKSLVKQNTYTFEEETSMACDFLTTFKLDHIKALHDFVVVEFTKGRSVNDEVFVGLAKSTHNFVVIFSLGDDAVGRDDISNFTENFFLLSNGIGSDLLLLLNLGIEGFRLSDLCFTLVLAFACLFLFFDNI